MSISLVLLAAWHQVLPPTPPAAPQQIRRRAASTSSRRSVSRCALRHSITRRKLTHYRRWQHVLASILYVSRCSGNRYQHRIVEQQRSGHRLLRRLGSFSAKFTPGIASAPLPCAQVPCDTLTSVSKRSLPLGSISHRSLASNLGRRQREHPLSYSCTPFPSSPSYRIHLLAHSLHLHHDYHFAIPSQLQRFSDLHPQRWVPSRLQRRTSNHHHIRLEPVSRSWTRTDRTDEL